MWTLWMRRSTYLKKNPTPFNKFVELSSIMQSLKDITILAALNEIYSEQSKTTKNTEK